METTFLAHRQDQKPAKYVRPEPAFDQEQLHQYVSDACLAVTRRQDDSIQAIQLDHGKLEEKIAQLIIRLDSQQTQFDSQVISKDELGTVMEEFQADVELLKERITILNRGRFRFYGRVLKQSVPLFKDPVGKSIYDQGDATVSKDSWILLEHPMQKCEEHIWIRTHLVDERGDISIYWVPLFGSIETSAGIEEVTYVGEFSTETSPSSNE